MNGVGLTTVGRLLGHRQRDTTAIYAHLDDGTLRDAAAQAAAIIASAMQFKPGASPAPEASAGTGSAEEPDGALAGNRKTAPEEPHHPNVSAPERASRDRMDEKGSAKAHPEAPDCDWLAADTFGIGPKPGRDYAQDNPAQSRDLDWL